METFSLRARHFQLGGPRMAAALKANKRRRGKKQSFSFSKLRLLRAYMLDMCVQRMLLAAADVFGFFFRFVFLTRTANTFGPQRSPLRLSQRSFFEARALCLLRQDGAIGYNCTASLISKQKCPFFIFPPCFTRFNGTWKWQEKAQQTNKKQKGNANRNNQNARKEFSSGIFVVFLHSLQRTVVIEIEVEGIRANSLSLCRDSRQCEKTLLPEFYLPFRVSRAAATSEERERKREREGKRCQSDCRR